MSYNKSNCYSNPSKLSTLRYQISTVQILQTQTGYKSGVHQTRFYLKRILSETARNYTNLRSVRPQEKLIHVMGYLTGVNIYKLRPLKFQHASQDYRTNLERETVAEDERVVVLKLVKGKC